MNSKEASTKIQAVLKELETSTGRTVTGLRIGTLSVGTIGDDGGPDDVKQVVIRLSTKPGESW